MEVSGSYVKRYLLSQKASPKTAHKVNLKPPNRDVESPNPLKTWNCHIPRKKDTKKNTVC